MKFILGKKLGMTQVFRGLSEVVPVTRVQAGPCPVVQVKAAGQKSAAAVQIGWGAIPAFRLAKPQAGHLKGLPAVRHLRDFPLESGVAIKRGDFITVETFAVGDRVTVTGVSKGKGFAGVVKRHHFAGGPASHGHKDNLRAPGSIGAGGVQRVFKGRRMAGRLGGDQVTVKNLEIVEIHPEINELSIKGALPGAREGLLEIYAAGELKTQSAIPAAAASESVSAAAAPVTESGGVEVKSSAPAESPAPAEAAPVSTV
ncbi:MAG: 50S ribosomal protein L3 [Candidatus Magasanikbacteria bacterium]|nr:50S ribosomal protein L3 [Candidatus Magasanikbacteria bacterium]